MTAVYEAILVLMQGQAGQYGIQMEQDTPNSYPMLDNHLHFAKSILDLVDVICECANSCGHA